MGAFSEAIGGLFLALGLQTRITSFLIMCTMLVAIFLQKCYNLYLGSGRFGIDYLISKKLK